AWYCPHQRFVIFPDEIHISHSMRQLLRRGTYRMTINEDFDGVISNCSELRIEESGAWLGPDMISAYTQLHDQGFAFSVETWQDDRLVGGLYGVNIGRAFFGESMFSLAPSASKAALIHLAHFMKEHGGTMIDCQLETPHLRSMGGRFISYKEYMDILQK
ncbi:MAG: leucyl/phenylalanyl-tRNA--protein transferase, partial [Prevotella sp.]|nr:leucyl/phenylalanyl-tRNA--protein transferase [Prevotella sp.]